MSPTHEPEKDTNTTELAAVEFVFDPEIQSRDFQQSKIAHEMDRLTSLNGSEPDYGKITDETTFIDGIEALVHTTRFDPPLKIKEKRAQNGVHLAYDAFAGQQQTHDAQTEQEQNPMGQHVPGVPETYSSELQEAAVVAGLFSAMSAGCFAASALINTSWVSNSAQFFGYSAALIGILMAGTILQGRNSQGK